VYKYSSDLCYLLIALSFILSFFFLLSSLSICLCELAIVSPQGWLDWLLELLSVLPEPVFDCSLNTHNQEDDDSNNSVERAHPFVAQGRHKFTPANLTLEERVSQYNYYCCYCYSSFLNDRIFHYHDQHQQHAFI
jgi:hypothetical protein